MGYDYDLIVIGGGMAGLPAAKIAASQYKKKVALIDYYPPAKNGGTFPRPGGVCLVAGCIPKKFMTCASSLRRKLDCDAETFGIVGPNNKRIMFNKNYECDWNTIMGNIKETLQYQSNVEKEALQEAGVEYISGVAKFVDDHTLQYAPDGENFTEQATAENIIVAVGCRPRLVLDEECIGAEQYTSSTDDFFQLPFAPESVLIIGSGFIGVEFAGFMAGSAGISVTILIRDNVLGNMDQEMVTRMTNYMCEGGLIRLVRPCVASRIVQIQEGTEDRLPVFRVYGKDPEQTRNLSSYLIGDFNCVVLAIGRDMRATSNLLDCKAAGINVARDGSIVTNNFKTNVPNIFAVGDICSEDRIILAPVSARCARILVTNLYEGTNLKMDFSTIPRTVSAPVQYGSCGMSENEAIKAYGEANVEIYFQNFRPYEWSLSAYTGRRKDKLCYCKLIVETKSIPGKERVVGYHYFGPHACDIMQFTACHLKMGLTKDQLDQIVPVHPTNASRFLRMKTKKTKKGDDDKDLKFQRLNKLPKGPTSFTRYASFTE